jgi:hypothetical protein
LNRAKQLASDAFGSDWNKIYSDYSAGRANIDKIDNFINLDPRANAADINKQVTGIQKLLSTPEGRTLAQQHLDEFLTNSGVDIKNPLKSIQDIADKQTALDEADKSLSEAQKAARQAQRASDIADLKQQQKMSTFKGRHPLLMQNLNYEAKRAAWGLLGGSIIGALSLSTRIRNLFSGK